MIKASINTIESCGLVDGPGLRYVIFFNGCKLRCKYCHNPEMWCMQNYNYTADDLLEKILRCKPYFKNNGGVTFSGGEPLLHSEFIIELSKKLKDNCINVALDTAGVGNGHYEKVLENIDLVILDIKHTDRDKYKSLTGHDMDESLKFIDTINLLNKKVWIRQVIIPSFNDNIEYMKSLIKFIKKIKNVEKVEFLPYHKLGSEKYKSLNIYNPMTSYPEMDKFKCNELYDYFMKGYKNEK